LGVNGLAFIGRRVLTSAVVASVLTTGSTFAQTAGTVPSDRSRINASELLNGQDATAPFENLAHFLVTGHEVVVTDTTGSSRRGHVISISPDDIVLSAPVAAGQWAALRSLLLPLPYFGAMELLAHIRHPKDRAFTEDAVNRIESSIQQEMALRSEERSASGLRSAPT